MASRSRGDERAELEAMRDEEHHRRTKETAHGDNLASARREEPRPAERAEHLEFLTDFDLPEDTERVLHNLFSRDFVLANFTDAEVHEKNWLWRVLKMEARIMHPPEESVFQGGFREYVSDGEALGVSALSASQKVKLNGAIERARSRTTRGREGWQQEKEAEVRRVSETIDRTDGDGDDGGWF